MSHHARTRVVDEAVQAPRALSRDQRNGRRDLLLVGHIEEQGLNAREARKGDHGRFVADAGVHLSVAVF